MLILNRVLHQAGDATACRSDELGACELIVILATKNGKERILVSRFKKKEIPLRINSRW